MPDPIRRNSGIDLLRIISMLMVAILHVISFGGIYLSLTRDSSRYAVASMWFAACYGGVNCFGMITGYVHSGTRYRYSSLIVLWLQVVFTWLAVTVILELWFLHTVTPGDLLSALHPVLNSHGYWYVTGYFGLYLLIPLLNAGISRLSQRQLTAVTLSMLVLQTVPRSFFGLDLFGVGDGCNMLWLIMLYIAGAWLRRCDPLPRLKSAHCLALYAVSVLVTWLVNRYRWSGASVIANASPFEVAASVFLMLGLLRRSYGDRARKAIGFFSPLAFGFYLIQMNVTCRHLLYTDNCLVSLLQLPTLGLAAAIPLVGAALLLLGMLLDLPRHCLFRALKLKPRLNALEERLLGDLWHDAA